MLQKTTEKKYMSCKTLFFLPLVQSMSPNNAKKTATKPPSANLSTSIEAIIQKKSIRNNSPSSVEVLAQKPIAPDNFYNKYQSLPKIFQRRNRKGHQNIPPQAHSSSIKPQSKDEKTFESSLKQGFKLNEANSLMISDVFFKEHFRRRIRQQTSKMQFKCTFPPEKNMLFDQTIDQKQQLPRVKYTKIETPEEENLLQTVPNFLMKLITHPKHIV